MRLLLTSEVLIYMLRSINNLCDWYVPILSTASSHRIHWMGWLLDLCGCFYGIRDFLGQLLLIRTVNCLSQIRPRYSGFSWFSVVLHHLHYSSQFGMMEGTLIWLIHLLWVENFYSQDYATNNQFGFRLIIEEWLSQDSKTTRFGITDLIFPVNAHPQHMCALVQTCESVIFFQNGGDYAVLHAEFNMNVGLWFSQLLVSHLGEPYKCNITI